MQAEVTAQKTGDTGNRAAKLRSVFPVRFGKAGKVPSELIGARILRIGSREEIGDLKLRIRFKTKSGLTKEIALAFTELGMWIYSDRRFRQSNQDASLS